MPRPNDDLVEVGGIRYRVTGAQLALFEHQLRAVVLSDNAAMALTEQEQAEDFLVQLPVWALQDVAQAAETIAESARQLVELRTA